MQKAEVIFGILMSHQHHHNVSNFDNVLVKLVTKPT